MTRLRTLLLAAAAATLLGGCMFSAAGRDSSRKAAAETAAYRTSTTRVLNGFIKALKGKLWNNAEGYCYTEDADSIRALKSRVEALWRRGQLLELTVNVTKVRREKEYTIATVEWERTLLEKGQLNTEEGKGEVFFRRQDEVLKIATIERDSFL